MTSVAQSDSTRRRRIFALLAFVLSALGGGAWQLMPGPGGYPVELLLLFPLGVWLTARRRAKEPARARRVAGWALGVRGFGVGALTALSTAMFPIFADFETDPGPTWRIVAEIGTLPFVVTGIVAVVAWALLADRDRASSPPVLLLVAAVLIAEPYIAYALVNVVGSATWIGYLLVGSLRVLFDINWLAASTCLALGLVELAGDTRDSHSPPERSP